MPLAVVHHQVTQYPVLFTENGDYCSGFPLIWKIGKLLAICQPGNLLEFYVSPGIFGMISRVYAGFDTVMAVSCTSEFVLQSNEWWMSHILYISDPDSLIGYSLSMPVSNLTSASVVIWFWLQEKEFIVICKNDFLCLVSQSVLCWQVTTDLHNDCTLEFQGTSSAAPLAAGCIALVLEAKCVSHLVPLSYFAGCVRKSHRKLLV